MIPVHFSSASALSAAYVGSIVVPVACTLEKLMMSPLIDATATSGFRISVTNKARGSASINYNLTSAVLATNNDWSAGRMLTFYPSSDREFSAGTLVAVQISSSNGTPGFGTMLQFNINDKLER